MFLLLVFHLLILKIIERLELKNVICTWDALNTQKSNVKAVVDKKGEYVVPIKKNHERFLYNLHTISLFLFDNIHMLLLNYDFFPLLSYNFLRIHFL